MTPNNQTLNQTPPGLRRLVEALQLEADCFKRDTISSSYEAIRLPKKEDQTQREER